MSASPAPGTSAASGLPAGLWGRQAQALVRLEMRKIFRGKGMIFLVLLPLMPVLLFLSRALIPSDEENFFSLPRMTRDYAEAFQTFVLPFVVFMGCAIVFTNLFRKEILDKSLHYLSLAVSRWQARER